MPEASLGIDLKGKVAFVAGVADSAGYGWAIVKALSEAGATVAVGTWPPVLAIFEKSLQVGEARRRPHPLDGSKMAVPKIYPLDAVFDEPDDVPDDVKNNKRYAGLDGYMISEVAAKVQADYGKVDVLVHSLANGPEVKRPLMQVSRNGYLAAASASSYSMVEPGAEVHAVHEQGRLDPLALVRRRRARRARLRRRDVVGEGAVRVGHEGARV